MEKQNITIRRAEREDLPAMQAIFAHAREEMAKNGNPTQWKNDRPPLFLIENDLKNRTSYVVEDDGRVCATFSFTPGDDPTYAVIEDGAWVREAPYGALHRIASDNTVKGMLGIILDFVSSFGMDIRVDTHRDNKIMLHLLEKNGFTRCGTIWIDDGTSRIAFQKVIGENHGNDASGNEAKEN